MGRKAGFLIYMAFSAASLGFLAFHSYLQNFGMAFLGANGTWLAYLLAHHSAEGKFVDSGEAENRVIPDEKTEIFGTLLGSLILVSGMIVGAASLRSNDLSMTVLAACIFMSGYVVTHLSATGEPL